MTGNNKIANLRVEQLYEMKKLALWGGVFMCLFLGMNTAVAQNSDSVSAKVNKRPLLNQFESDYVLTASERIALKQSRIAYQYRVKEILDSVEISDRKRKRLLLELKRNPFSEKIKEAVAEYTLIEE
ncbi:hypothetical protein SAMN05192545_1262 [Maribacter dokdonensis]|uniref:DUF4168 domain-containing protein n=3 Tax=Flavobacteriaceae TaxID=49546 RepID=A0ABY0UAT7_9FLAO|nr:hypothetical protein SAMN05192545_1262 [Maribacter dokdonensis]